MEFSRLRLAGFKSFVDATDFLIEPGLTGVVGPNGCGKSNLLEALRWVMGANSAKALRGEGMEDVIFAGSRDRPPRNHAEVVLTIDNADRTAPAQFNQHLTLEVSRRIDRGEGSTYRVNGVEVRARDVQLLFADASTGANSPALVRQGQISELIAAKPQNRRRILEEAAGVAGLHGRRHEAELRVRAAEANLARLEDIAKELENQLSRARREARQAARFKTLAGRIRTLRGALLLARWNAAEAQVAAAETESAEAERQAGLSAGAAARAQTTALAVQAALGPLREEETLAAAILHQLEIEADRLERAVEAAAEEERRLIAALARLEQDSARETAIIADAESQTGRAASELEAVAAAIAAAPQREPELRAALDLAESARRAADAEVEALAARQAAADAERRALAQRLEDARVRLGRAQRALERAQADRAALGPATDPRLELTQSDLATAQAGVADAQAHLEAAEAARSAAVQAEETARREARKAEDQLARSVNEAAGLARLTAAPTKSGRRLVLDHVSAGRGLEAALAAALGDDVNVALDADAPAYFGGAQTPDARPPAGAEPLAPLIAAPPELAARLAMTFLVDRVEGARLQKSLAPGMRLVSREGDLWRWDGLVVTAEAPRAAQVRLEQRTRLNEVEAVVAALRPEVEAKTAAQKAAAQAVRDGETAVREARATLQASQVRALRAREAMEALAREGARRDAQAQSLDGMIASFGADAQEAETQLKAAEAAASELAPAEDLAVPLAAARETAGAAREAALEARAVLDQEVRGAADRQRRREGLEREIADWAARAVSARKRVEQLTAEQAKTAAALKEARAAPESLAKRRQSLADQLEGARARRARASDAMAAGETARAEADRALRAADAEASAARESRATLTARLEAARERRAEQALAIVEADGGSPAELSRRLAEEGVNLGADSESLESRLGGLERERETLGAVNLRADEEAEELSARLETMAAERADLTGALAKLRGAIAELNEEGRERLLAAFEIIDAHFRSLFTTLFEGGQAELRLVESEDPLEAGLEIMAQPPGKRLATMSLMSGGEQALTAVALIFAVFLANPAPICVLDEVDAPLDDANVGRFCDLLAEMRKRARTRFVAITHNPVTMSRMDRLFGVTMRDRGVSQLVSVDLRQAEALAAQ